MKNASNRLLIIDDEPAIRDFVGTVGKRLGFEVKDTGDTDRFRSLVREFEPTALALDLRLPQTDGIELLRFLAEEHSNAKVVVISGADDRVLSAAKRLGTSQGLAMVGSLQKPISIEALEEVLSDTIQRAITKEDLSEAIELGQLLVYYQPKISLDGSGKGTVGGAEALLRWDHPEYGIFMPGEFIPLAESTGLIAPITEFVLRETLKQIRFWHDEGLEINAAVNMAPQQLIDLNFPDHLSALLREVDLDGSRLTLEVTETVAMNHAEPAMDILARLRLKRVELSIDDFGTGYSSLKQLFYMPFSELKIDQSFVSELAASNEARTIVRTIIQLAHNLNMTVCAEGVETAEILEFLTEEGCDKAQGHYIARALHPRGFFNFASQHRPNWSAPIIAHPGRRTH